MRQINDRFRFDALFSKLLKVGCSHEEVLQIIMNNYSLGTLVVQERIENNHYLRLKPIDRIHGGHAVRIKSIYGQLQKSLGVKIQPAPDEWDRLFNLDFYIKINDKYVGLQIKPVSEGIQLPQIYKEKALQEKTHKEFTEVFGGKVFYVFSKTIDGKKEIVNQGIIDEIMEEVARLKIL
jgi:hypothetical protein